MINLNGFLNRFYPLMIFSHIVKFATFCHCKCHMDGLRLNNRFLCQFRMLYRFLFQLLCYKLGVDLLLLCLLLQVNFHLRKISLQCSGSSLCDRVNIHPDSRYVNAILMKHIKQIILPGRASVFHHHIQVRILLFHAPATASGYHYIHDFHIQTVFINLRLHISIHCLFNILCTLPVKAVKKLLCLCTEICNHIWIVLSKFCLSCFQFSLLHLFRFL